MHVLGIDVGGSGIKGNIVDTVTGELLDKRHRIETPQPATPKAIAKTINAIADHFDWNGKIGCGFPAVVQHGVAKTASNIDPAWINTDAEQLFAEITGRHVCVLNDADAAGLAEIRFGAGRDCDGCIVILTIGTGIGSALFSDGVMIPNTELGHLYFKNMDAEDYISDATRKAEDLKWDEWGTRFNEYLHYIERTFWPDRIILGGGASKKFQKFSDTITCDCEVVPAELLNNAGIIGAACAAAG